MDTPSAMDTAWKSVYTRKSYMDIPDHEKSCWSKEGFEQLLTITLTLIKQIPECKTILDVGCGPGVYCNKLDANGYQVTGIDYVESLIKHAKEKYPHLTFHIGSGYDLAYEDHAFDVVISIGALQCLEHHEKFIKELCRTAKHAVIISTYIREVDADNPRAILKKQLSEDTWPIREYNKDELVPLFEQEGFKTEIIRTHQGIPIKEGAFIIAKKDLSAPHSTQ